MNQKSFLNWIAGGIALLVVLFFIKYEMAANRQALTHDLQQSIKDAPATMVPDAIDGITQSLTNRPGTNGGQPDGGKDLLGSLSGLATAAGQRASQALSNGVAGSPNEPSQPGDLLHNVLNLAGNAERQVDALGLQATEMSSADEIELGRQMDQEILTEMPVADDPVNTARLQTLAGPLVAQCSRKEIPYDFRLVKSDVVNAFSIAGGHVYVTTAFLKRFPADPQLAMVLGHEIAHVELKHAVHKVQYYYQGRKIIGEAAAIGQLCYSVLSSPYAKDQEYEADAWGFAACKKAGWESDQLLQTFDTLAKYEQEERVKDNSAPPTEFEREIGDYFDSHPKTAERLERLKQLK